MTRLRQGASPGRPGKRKIAKAKPPTRAQAALMAKMRRELRRVIAADKKKREPKNAR